MADHELALNTMKEALTEKVRGMVMDMLPEEMIHKAIEGEFKLLVEGRIEPNRGYSGGRRSTRPCSRRGSGSRSSRSRRSTSPTASSGGSRTPATTRRSAGGSSEP